jgi:hypothetical protein
MAKSPALALTLDGRAQTFTIQGRSVAFQAGAGSHSGNINVK